MNKMALATAGIFLLAPVAAEAFQLTQSSQAPTTPGAPKAAPVQNVDEPATAQVPPAATKPAVQADEPAASQAPPAATNGGQAGAACVSPGKNSGSAATTHPSAKVGKDTGELPPPRTRPSSSCLSQPNQ